VSYPHQPRHGDIGGDRGNAARTDPDHLERQLREAGYDSFRRLGGRTGALAS
jgi:hypothetical protein